jgi:hypothetical protein
MSPRARRILRAVRGVALLGVVAWDARACGGSAPAPAVPCSPVAGQLPAGASADAFGAGGSYRLTLVATAGAKSGQTTSGTLRLTRYAGAGRTPPPAGEPGSNARYPLYGSAEIALDGVGAAAAGAITSSSEARPGVLVIERTPDTPNASKEITLRFGADANRADATTPFDGTYMALFVHELTANGFAGRWSSGAAGQEASGHFCASR